jgi:hypothetical protein
MMWKCKECGELEVFLSMTSDKPIIARWEIDWCTVQLADWLINLRLFC